MEKFFVADSYKDMEVIGEPFDNEKGRKVVKVRGKCDKCGGLGIIVSRVENGRPIPIPVDNGVCYKCGGAKTINKVVRAYTKKEYNAMQRAKQRSRERAEAAAAARNQKLLDNAAEYKHQVALKLGFGEDEKAYLVYGDDTYAIKDELKKMGARFDPTLKWFFSSKVELPEGYYLCEFNFDELYDYKPMIKWADFKEDAPNIVRKRIDKLVKSIRGFEGYYGYTNIYTFTSEDYVFVWMTSKYLEVEAGDTIDLTGTIKKFDEYAGVNQTYLTRCVVKKIEQ